MLFSAQLSGGFALCEIPNIAPNSVTTAIAAAHCCFFAKVSSPRLLFGSWITQRDSKPTCRMRSGHASITNTVGYTQNDRESCGHEPRAIQGFVALTYYL